MSEPDIRRQLEELSFAYCPNLPGNPDFVHFGVKLVICIFSRREAYDQSQFYNKFRQRFSELRSKRWQCIAIFEEDSLEEKLNHIKGFMVEREFAKIRTPAGPEPIHKKLIELLKQTEVELEAEEKRRCRHIHIIWGLKERRKKIEKWLHTLLKPAILRRDNNRCRACGSSKTLELVRLYTGDMARPEKIGNRRMWKYPAVEMRWAEENMLILCKECHKLFDSLNARLWRRHLGILSIDETLELLRSGKLKEVPPSFKQYAILRYQKAYV